MKAEKFSESLNQISDRYVDEAASYRQPAHVSQPTVKMKSSRSMKVWRGIAIAACALLAVGVGAAVIGLSGGGGSSYTSEPSATPPGYADSKDYTYGLGAAESIDGEAYNEDGYYDEATEASGERNNDYDSTMPENEGAKIIYTASVSIDTTEFSNAQALIEEATKSHGGYYENLDQSSGSSSYQSAYYQIRIPEEEFEAFLKEAEQFGTVTSISQNAADVSDYYYDIESRLETAKAKLARLQELLGQAQNMSDIITIENEIEDVQWEIDDLSGTLKYYDSQVSYSTVSISLHEVYKTTVEEAPTTFGERISFAFRNGVSAFGEALGDIAVWLAASWTWLLLILLVVAAAIIIPIHFATKNKKETQDDDPDDRDEQM